MYQCQLGAINEPKGALSNRPIPDPTRPHPLKKGVEKAAVDISAYTLEANENVNSAHFTRSGAMSNRTRLSPKPQMSDRRYSTKCGRRAAHHCGADFAESFDEKGLNDVLKLPKIV